MGRLLLVSRHACLPFAARKVSMGVMRIVVDPPSDASARRCAVEGNDNVRVLNLLGPLLGDLFTTSQEFSLKTVPMVAGQMLHTAVMADPRSAVGLAQSWTS